MGPNLFPIRNISKLFFSIHDKKKHAIKPGLFAPGCTKELQLQKEMMFQLVGNTFGNLESLERSLFCSLVKILRN